MVRTSTTSRTTLAWTDFPQAKCCCCCCRLCCYCFCYGCNFKLLCQSVFLAVSSHISSFPLSHPLSLFLGALVFPCRNWKCRWGSSGALVPVGIASLLWLRIASKISQRETVLSAPYIHPPPFHTPENPRVRNAFSRKCQSSVSALEEFVSSPGGRCRLWQRTGGAGEWGKGGNCRVWRYGDKVQTFDKLTALRRKCCCNVRQQQQQHNTHIHHNTLTHTQPDRAAYNFTIWEPQQSFGFPSPLFLHPPATPNISRCHTLIDLWSQTTIWPMTLDCCWRRKVLQHVVLQNALTCHKRKQYNIK